MCGSPECLGIDTTDLDCSTDVNLFDLTIADELLVESLPPKLRRIIRSYLVIHRPDKAYHCEGCYERGVARGRAERDEELAQAGHTCPPSVKDVLGTDEDAFMAYSTWGREFDRYLETDVADLGGHLRKYRLVLNDLLTKLKEHGA